MVITSPPPTTSSKRHHKTHTKHGKTPTHKVAGPGNMVTFVLRDWPNPKPYFTVMVDPAQAFTVTDGWALWNIVDRPQRVGLPVFAGYDPITATIGVQFEGFPTVMGATSDAARGSKPSNEVEDAIQLLEFMSGRGQAIGAGNNSVDAAATTGGPPPAVWLQSNNEQGQPTNLIPQNYQVSEANPNAPSWVVTNLAWDTTPMRDDNGNRIRQMCVITVQEIVSDTFIPTYSATQSFKTRNGTVASQKTQVMYSTAKLNTLRKIAVLFLHGDAALAQQLATLNGLRSIDSPTLTLGTAVRYPS